MNAIRKSISFLGLALILSSVAPCPARANPIADACAHLLAHGGEWPDQIDTDLTFYEACAVVGESPHNAGPLIDRALSYLIREARLKPKTADQLAKDLAQLLHAIRFRMLKTTIWNYSCFRGDDGAYGFIGLGGFAIVIRPTGDIYRGKLSNDLYGGGVWIADYSILSHLRP